MFSDDRLSDGDVEALLTETAEYIDYPREPDFSGRIRRELSGPHGAVVRTGRRSDDSSVRSPAQGPARQPAADLQLPTPGSGGWRQALRIIAVGAAMLVVGLLVVIVLREMRAEPDRVANRGRPELRDVFITTFSDSTGADDYYSYLLIRDANTLDTIYRLPVDLGGWFTISSDGTRLYAAGDRYLTAVDLRTGGTVWEVPLVGRHLRELGLPGLATPVVSPDGTRLYVYGTETGFTYWVEEVDAATGERIRVSERSPDPSSGCNARMYPSPDGQSLYLPCTNDRIAVLDVGTMRWIESLEFPPQETAQPGGGELLFALSNGGEIAVVNMNARQIVERQKFIDLPAEDQDWIIAQATVSRDGESLAVVLADETIRGPIIARQFRLYDTGTWDEVHRVTPEVPIVGGGLTPDHSGGFLIVEEDEEGNLEPMRLDRDGLEPLGHSLSDGTEANYHRTVAASIATGASAASVCPATPQTTDTEIRERYGLGATHTVEAADMYINFWAPIDGDGVGYTRYQDAPDGRVEGGWHYITVLVFGPVGRDIEVAGYRLDAAGDLRFGETERPDVASAGRPEPARDGSGLGERIRIDARVQGPGCYGMVIKWDGNYETVIFEVVD